MKRNDQATTPLAQEARATHPAVAATVKEQQVLREATARLEALFGDPQALASTLQHAIAAAICEHHAAGRPVYFSKGGIIYEEDASGQQRPFQVQQPLPQESVVTQLRG